MAVFLYLPYDEVRTFRSTSYPRLVLPAAFGYRPSQEESSEFSTIAVLPASNLFPAQLHPLNSWAKFSLIKPIGYKGLSQVCNSFVNQVTQDTHFINHYFLYLSVFYLFLGYKACNFMQSIICPK